MRLLVLGGTRFLGWAAAAEAVRRGHEVVCAARGVAGAVPEGARLVVVDRDREDGLAPLVGERFDAVVDVATISHPWVRRALDALGEGAGHWTFISSISAYADFSTPPTGTGDRVLAPRAEHGDRPLTDPGLYGAVKVASEEAVRAAVGDRAFVVRAGLISGPGDEHDRFGYWVNRFSRGGRAVVPDADHLIQHVDVRDLAAWVVTAAEQGTTGTFDGVGPAVPLLDLLDGVREVAGGGAEPVLVPEQALVDLGVRPWAGPQSLPLWLTPPHRYMGARDAGPALAAGLEPRPLADTVAGAMEREVELGLDRQPRGAGLTPDEERAVLAAVDAT
ncbi:NAD-dependent epimerase/dehydratase family protein [Actinokineospora bangkokensis]|uniref:Epimerase n=1 Tax=Actinokineospora bangkokensis TaxID=1193682 RepID=A0A1Q9LFU4_9PSEU|nr:NAD-dependent epimerase/dehydratase family protein [Actinokineospora bangkokensis]OLR90890.1 epimerase [Actinokineospora bangkokensis]